MAGKIGVYFDQQNIGGGLDVPALAVQTGEKWGDLTPVVKVVPVLAAAVEGAGVPGELITIIDQGDNWSYPETTRV